MTDQGPRSLLPGSALRAPYGMTPGQRAVLPGVNDGSATAWNRYPEPDKIDLDAPDQPAPGMATAPAPEPQQSLGWVLTDPNGNAIHIRSDAHKQRDAEQVKALGDALAKHAVTPEEQVIAQRATEWGMAQVGQADIGDIRSSMAHFWDNGVGNQTKLDLQSMRSKVRHGGGGGAPGIGPTKGDKWDAQRDDTVQRLTNDIISAERQSDSAKKMAEHEQTLGMIDDLMSSKRGLQERIGVQNVLLELTDKASRESEQSAITGGAGKWNELRNRISQWTSDNPTLSDAYVAEMRGMLATSRAALRKQREALAIRTATRVRDQLGGHGPEVANRQAGIAYGTISGNSPTGSYAPPAAAAKPSGDQYSDLD